MKRVLILTVYPSFWAGTRLRAEQYRPYFEERGITTTLWSFLRDGDMDRWYGGTNLERLMITARGVFRSFRVPLLIRRSDATLVLREILPFGPPILERLAARRRPLIWDLDDALWESGRSHFLPWVPGWIRRSRGKFETICRMASEVWAATAVIEDWCLRHNRSVRVVPTVVEVPADRPERELRPVVGWIGAPSTGRFLETILPALERVEPLPEVLVLGADVGGGHSSCVTAAGWTLDREEEVLAKIAVGLYPIDLEHPLAEGKAALKAILYMSRGIPAVVTPTRTNAAIVRDGVEGLHALTLEDWTRQVQRLLNDPDLWKRCSVASHARALADFSVHRWGPVVAGYMDGVLSGVQAGSGAKAVSKKSPDDSRLIAWTGERCVPWADEPQMVAEHLHRYYFSANLARDKEVLDLASGEGYGSMILAETASRVLGVEIDPLAVEHAKRRYTAPNLTFIEGSALDLQPLPEASFDVVVSFELVEHLSDHERLMSEISRVLRQNGLLIMSTPDRKIYSEASGHVNPHHLRELSEAEFAQLLTRYFPHVSIFGQRCGMASTITPRSPEAGGKGTGPELFSVQRGAQRWNLMAESPALYLVAVASRMPLPQLPSSTLLDSGHEAGSVPVRLRHPALSLTIRLARGLWHAVRRKAALSLRAWRRRQQARRH